METSDILGSLHETAREFVAALDRPAATQATTAAEDDLLASYGFDSLEALEYLLMLEEKFGITFEDEDLNEEVLGSAQALATYIGTKRSGPAALKST
jgi:acyl carrier protein